MNVTDTSIAFFLCGDMNVAKHFFTIWRSGHAAMEQLMLDFVKGGRAVLEHLISPYCIYGYAIWRNKKIFIAF